MLKQKSILSVLLSILVLSTSLGAVVYRHYCGESLQDVALVESEKHCDHHANSEEMPPCHKHEADSEGCCKTESQKIAVEDIQQQKEGNSILKSGATFVSAIYVLVNYLFSNPLDSQTKVSVFAIDPPPILKPSLKVLYQSFLI